MTTFLIVTPSFNQAEFLKKTVDSVLSQVGALEVKYVVMDGASTDDTVSLLEQLGSEFFWKSEKDAGQTDAINKGILHFREMIKNLQRKEKNEYIFAYLNSDDFYLPNAFQRVQQAFLTKPNAKWVVGDAIIVDEKNSEIQQPIRWYKALWRLLYSKWLLSMLNPLPQPAVFVRWSAIEEVGLFNRKLQFAMDYEYWHRLQLAFGNPIRINQTLAAFRIHEKSKGATRFEAQFEEELLIAQRFTKNNWLLFIHKLHNTFVTNIYKLLK